VHHVAVGFDREHGIIRVFDIGNTGLDAVDPQAIVHHLTVSPGRPITRFTSRVSAAVESKTTMSPRLGSANL